MRARGSECMLLDGLGSAIRQGESRSLVLRGEPGVGKTALLDYLVESASDLTVVRAAGVESEMELAFASLHQLCAPLLDRLERLPAPQRQALGIVFAAREPGEELQGLPELEAGGLRNGDRGMAPAQGVRQARDPLTPGACERTAQLRLRARPGLIRGGRCL